MPLSYVLVSSYGNKLFLPYVDNLRNYKDLTNKLIEMGYKADIILDRPVGMIISLKDKSFGARDSGTILSCYCLTYNIVVNLTITEFSNNIDDILINFDFIKYNELLLKKYRKRNNDIMTINNENNK